MGLVQVHYINWSHHKALKFLLTQVNSKWRLNKILSSEAEELAISSVFFYLYFESSIKSVRQVLLSPEGSWKERRQCFACGGGTRTHLTVGHLSLSVPFFLQFFPLFDTFIKYLLCAKSSLLVCIVLRIWLWGFGTLLCSQLAQRVMANQQSNPNKLECSMRVNVE